MQRFALDKKSLSGAFGHRLVSLEGGIIGALVGALASLGSIFVLGAGRLHWVWLGLFCLAIVAIAMLWLLRAKIEKKAADVAEILSSGEHRIEFDPATQHFTLKIMGKVDMGIGTPSDVTVRQVRITKEQAEAVRAIAVTQQIGGPLFLTQPAPENPAAAAAS